MFNKAPIFYLFLMICLAFCISNLAIFADNDLQSPDKTQINTSQDQDKETEIYSSDFKNSKDWNCPVLKWGDVKIKNGELLITISEVGGAWIASDNSFKIPTNNYIVQTDAYLKSGDDGAYALIFNLVDWKILNCYVFEVNPFMKTYYFAELLPGIRWNFIIPSTRSPFIKFSHEINKLKVIVNGNKVRLFVNNEYLEDVDIQSDLKKDTRVALVGIGISHAPITSCFENLEISTLSNN